MNLHGGVDNLPTYVVDLLADSNTVIASGIRHGQQHYALFSATLRLCVKKTPQ
jgi:hypothetical protein